MFDLSFFFNMLNTVSLTLFIRKMSYMDELSGGFVALRDNTLSVRRIVGELVVSAHSVGGALRGGAGWSRCG